MFRTILSLILILNIYMPWHHATDDYIWQYGTMEQRSELSIEYLADKAGLTPTEFEYFARVIEAESDRSSSMDGRIAISAVIWNRVNSSSFPNTVCGVLDQSGQFSTTSGGWCYTNYTNRSKIAVIEGLRAIENEELPSNLLFFNCIGYNYGSAYDYIDGNYFMTWG